MKTLMNHLVDTYQVGETGESLDPSKEYINMQVGKIVHVIENFDNVDEHLNNFAKEYGRTIVESGTIDNIRYIVASELD